MTDREALLRELAKKTVVYRIPGMDAAVVRRDETYRVLENRSAQMDLYYPAQVKAGDRLPVVVVVIGYPDPEGYFRNMGWTSSWARLIAASGIVAVLYETRDPDADIRAVVQCLRQSADGLRIDERRIGLFAGSGHAVVALSALMQDSSFKGAALLYGYTLDLDGSTVVSDAAQAYGFVNACAGKTVGDLSPDVPLFIVRAGRDQFDGLNAALDRFAAATLARNLPVTVVNHHTGPHAFDLDDDSETSRDIVRQVLTFLKRALTS